MREVRLGSEAVEVSVLPEVGARLHRLRVFGHDLLRSPDDPEVHRSDPFWWGGYVMAPWCNRIAAAPTPVGDRVVRVEPNFPDGSAIHGQVYARPWAVTGPGQLRVDGGDDGWPWAYTATFEIEIDGTTARLDLRLTNRADVPMPAGIGLHPWFARPLRAAIRGAEVYPDNLAATPQPEAVAGRLDLRSIGDLPTGIDATWTALDDPMVEIEFPEAGIGATMRAEATTPHVVAASPSGPDAVAIEPQTHAPQGLRRLLNGEPGAMTLLDPGGTLRLGIELGFRRLSSPSEAPRRVAAGVRTS